MQEGSAASWAKENAASVAGIHPQQLAERASEKAHRAIGTARACAGRYTVILEPAAVLDLVGFLFYDFAATACATNGRASTSAWASRFLGKNIRIEDDVLPSPAAWCSV